MILNFTNDTQQVRCQTLKMADLKPWTRISIIIQFTPNLIHEGFESV